MFRRLSEIEKFLAVAEAGKIVAAAHRLAMTQPALTRAVAWLESRFGAPLFERLPTDARPTALGAVAAEQARRLLRAFEEAEDWIGGALAGRSGCIRATADALWMHGVVADAAGVFREAFPGIELRLRSAGRGRGAVPAGGRRQRPALRRYRRPPAPARPSAARAAAGRHHGRGRAPQPPAAGRRGTGRCSTGTAGCSNLPASTNRGLVLAWRTWRGGGAARSPATGADRGVRSDEPGALRIGPHRGAGIRDRRFRRSVALTVRAGRWRRAIPP